MVLAEPKMSRGLKAAKSKRYSQVNREAGGSKQAYKDAKARLG